MEPVLSLIKSNQKTTLLILALCAITITLTVLLFLGSCERTKLADEPYQDRTVLEIVHTDQRGEPLPVAGGSEPATSAPASPGPTRTIKRKTTTTEGGTEKTSETAKNTGGHLKAHGDNVNLKDAQLAPGAVSLAPAPAGGATASGGGFTGSVASAIEKSPWFRWVVFAGGVICVLLGALAVYTKQPIKASLGTAGIGAGLITCCFLPLIADFVLLGLAGYAVVCLWFTGQSAGAGWEFARAVGEVLHSANTPGNPAYDPNMVQKFMAMFKGPASPGDVKVMDQVRSADKLNIPVA